MKVNYPNPDINTNNAYTKTKSHGMMFENELNISNEYYRLKNIAVIYKKPTPVQVVKVDYKSRSTAKITEAYYKTPSTTDYNGLYKGKYIDYEAKETHYVAFPFTHIFPHQLEHLRKIDEHNGIAFVIIYYKRINEVYIIDIKDFDKLIYEGKNGGKKSIPVETANKVGKKVNLGYTPPLDYLKAVDELYFSK